MAVDAVARAGVVPAVVAAPVAVATGSFFSSCLFFWYMPPCYASWWALFTSISPYLFASVGTALAIGLSVLGAAWGIFITGVSLLGAAIKHPRIQSKNLISVIFCEAVAIYGVIMAIIMQSRIVEAEDGGLPSAYLGYALFAAGLTVGFSNLFCGYVLKGGGGGGGAPCEGRHSSIPTLWISRPPRRPRLACRGVPAGGGGGGGWGGGAWRVVPPGVGGASARAGGTVVRHERPGRWGGEAL